MKHYLTLIPLMFLVGCAGSCKPETVISSQKFTPDIADCHTALGDYDFRPLAQSTTLFLQVIRPPAEEGGEQTSSKLTYRKEQGSDDFYLAMASGDILVDNEPTRNSSASVSATEICFQFAPEDESSDACMAEFMKIRRCKAIDTPKETP